MKTAIITSALILTLAGGLNAQYLNPMGMPITEKPEISTNPAKDYSVVLEKRIVNSIPTPFNYSADIAFDGELIWIEGYNQYMLLGLNPENGNVMDTINIDIKRPYGLFFDGTYFWVLDNDNKLIEKISKETKLVEEIISINYGTQTYPTSLVVINGNLLFNDPIGPSVSEEGDLTVKASLNGEMLQSFSLESDYPSGIAFDGEFIWSTDNASQIINKINPSTFEVVEIIKAPGGLYPNGLTFDGTYLWVSNNDSDTLYQIDIEKSTTNIAEISKTKHFSIYPNIVTNNSKINCSQYKGENVNIEIFTQTGQIIETIFSGYLVENEMPLNINNNSLESGIYFCRITFKNSFSTEKFIVIK